MLIKLAEEADWKKGWEGGVREKAGKQHELECKGFACYTGHLKIFPGSDGATAISLPAEVKRQTPDFKLNGQQATGNHRGIVVRQGGKFIF